MKKLTIFVIMMFLICSFAMMPDDREINERFLVQGSQYTIYYGGRQAVVVFDYTGEVFELQEDQFIISGKWDQNGDQLEFTFKGLTFFANLWRSRNMTGSYIWRNQILNFAGILKKLY